MPPSPRPQLAAGAGAGAPVDPSLDALPDPLLSGILALAGVEEGSRVTLVCKRWERLFYSEPALWRHFLLRPATPGFPGAVGNSSQQELEEIWAHWCAAKHRQLARVAGLVEVFEAGPRRVDLGRMAGTGSRLDHFVSLLRPEVLTEALLYWGLPEMSELPRFPRLSRLLLHALVLNPGAARLLGGMPQLRSLGLHVHEVSGSNMSVILGLTQLTQLSFVVFNALTAGFNYQPSRDSEPRAPDLLQLTRLAALRHLTITHRPSLYQQEREEYEFGRQGVLPLPPPASFPALEFYHVSFRQDEWYSWAFSVGGAQLAGCQYAAGASGSIGRLEIVSARHVPSMPHLLAALVPPGKPLTTLELKNSQLWVGGPFMESPVVKSSKYEADPSGSTGLLEVVTAQHVYVPSLQQLLTSLVPAGKPLTALRMHKRGGWLWSEPPLEMLDPPALELSALAGSSALAGLHSLLLSGHAPGDAELAALLRQAPGLRELVLFDYFSGRLPASLEVRDGLETLQLVGGDGALHELPVARFLSSALCLKLLYNALRAGGRAPRLPKVTALRRLQLGSATAITPLPPDTVDRILPNLPYLHTQAQGPCDPDALPQLAASLPAGEALQQGYHLAWHLPASLLGEGGEDGCAGEGDWAAYESEPGWHEVSEIDSEEEEDVGGGPDYGSDYSFDGDGF